MGPLQVSGLWGPDTPEHETGQILTRQRTSRDPAPSPVSSLPALHPGAVLGSKADVILSQTLHVGPGFPTQERSWPLLRWGGAARSQTARDLSSDSFLRLLPSGSALGMDSWPSISFFWCHNLCMGPQGGGREPVPREEMVVSHVPVAAAWTEQTLGCCSSRARTGVVAPRPAGCCLHPLVLALQPCLLLSPCPPHPPHRQEQLLCGHLPGRARTAG